MNSNFPNIVHLSTADLLGGSAKAAYRIHKTLKDKGYKSRMLVRYKHSDDNDIKSVWPTGVCRVLDRSAEILSTRTGLQYLYVPSAKRIVNHPWIQGADIIQIYNLHGGYLSPFSLDALSKSAPIIWRLSDIWPFTGHCAYAGECSRWKTGCGSCPDLSSYPPIKIDFTSLLWRLKKKAYKESNITFVAPSTWIERIAQASPLVADCNIIRIPTGVDTAQFSPELKQIWRAQTRSMLGIPEHTTVILFTAHVIEKNSRKGGQHLTAALKTLGKLPNCILLVAGINAEEWARNLDFEVRSVGYLDQPSEMAKIYSAADISVVPSLDENLANTALEAMACGIPVIAFNKGGMSDAVELCKNGY